MADHVRNVAEYMSYQKFDRRIMTNLGTALPLEFHSLGTGVSPTRDCPACPGLMHSSFTAKDLILVRETDTQAIGSVYSL